jgi:hypothetical protein
LTVPNTLSANASSAGSSVGESTKSANTNSRNNRKRGPNQNKGEKTAAQPSPATNGNADNTNNNTNNTNKLQAIVSPPRNAMDIAKSTPRNPNRGREAGLGTVTSLQQKIDELKTLPPAPVNTTGISRRTSLTLGHDMASSSPLAIPGSGQDTSSATRSSFSSGSQGRLKADAPVFQPSNSPVSPSAVISPGLEAGAAQRGQRQPSVSSNRLSFSGSRRSSNPVDQPAGGDTIDGRQNE